MNILGEELDNLLNKYEKLNLPNEVGSYDLTEDSEIFTTEDIKPEDSISNSGEKIKPEDDILNRKELEDIKETYNSGARRANKKIKREDNRTKIKSKIRNKFDNRKL